MTSRLAAIRAAARRRDRAAGRPVNPSSAEVIAIRRELAEGIASGGDVDEVVARVAEAHGLSTRKVRYAAMTQFAGRPMLISMASETRDRKARMSERHRAAVRGWSE